jgi:poly-gamma-glutamate synthesis protein (capsule biosynthesis protein)
MKKRTKIKILINIILAVLAAATIYLLFVGRAIAPARLDKIDNNFPKQTTTNRATILAFGDLLLDRYIKRAIDKNTPNYPFEKIKDFLAGNNLVLANLEGSFTNFKPRPLDPNNATFTFDPKLASTLKDNGFNILNLANNHVQDFGKDGFAQSEAYLDKEGIDHFGDYYNQERALIKNINGLKLVFIAYSEFGDPATESTVAKIKDTSTTADFVIVYTHWGNEYQTKFSASQQEKARRFVDAGADIILGSHPHVIQPIEIYKNRPIFYSLGNFVFDQIFSFEVTHGLAVKLTLAKDKMEFELFPTELKNFQVSLAADTSKSAILKKTAANSTADKNIKDQIAAGKITLNF